MKKTITAIVAAALFAVSATTALATSDGVADVCTDFPNHSGSVPGNYDYAIFIEDQVLDHGRPDIHFSQRVDNPNPGSNFGLNPDRFDGSPYFYNNNSWDTVIKCVEADQPEDLVVEDEWVDGQFECDDTTVTQTRTVTTTVYVRNEADTGWVAGEPIVVVEEQVRELSEEEQIPCPPETTTTVPEETTTTPEVSTTVTSPPTTVPPPTSTPSTEYDPCSTKFEDECFSPTTQPEPPKPEEPQAPELPFTGIEMYLWAAGGAALLASGGFLVRRTRDER